MSRGGFEAHIAGRTVIVRGAVDNSQFIELTDAVKRTFGGRTLDFPVDGVVSLPEMLLAAFGPDFPAHAWTGEYHLHLGGKTGETIYAAAVYPLIKAVCPRARIVLHVHPAFREVALAVRPKPHAVLCLPWWTAGLGAVADQVSYGLRMASGWIGNAVRVVGSNLHTCLYRTYRGTEPFYRLFAQAAGVEGEMNQPAWARKIAAPRSALVFASGNKHTGGAREISLTPNQWADLAMLVRDNDLVPFTTTAPGDPQLTMPGWTTVETDKPEEIVDLLRNARRVVGLNSGIVFAAALWASGRVTMLDTQTKQRRPAYAFEPMMADGMIDEHHVQIPWEQAEGNLYETVRKALS